MEIDYTLILAEHFADYSWSVNGESYTGIAWHSEDRPKPTLDELNALWPETRKKYDRIAVQEQRKIMYARVSDPVFFEWQRGEASQQDWLNAVQSVKDKYPHAGE